jgi:hypothetical protein
VWGDLSESFVCVCVCVCGSVGVFWLGGGSYRLTSLLLYFGDPVQLIQLWSRRGRLRLGNNGEKRN